MKQPNIVMILTDDQGCADYSAYGTPDIRTPNIDRIFHEGMTFTNFFANSPVCSPSRAALLTGCHPDRVGVPGVIRHIEANSWGYLSPNCTLLPQTLKQQGYHSALVGKWHLGLKSPNLPNERGFDFFHGFLGDMMDDYWTHLRGGNNYMRLNHTVIEPEGHATDLFTTWACEYLQERSRIEQPFFLYLAYNAPHDPVQPPQEWLERVMEREPHMDPKRQKLVALIEHLDAGIGRVLDTLDQTGLTENTLVVFSSDNGGVLANGANNGPWRSEKGHVYDGGLRVPCAARWPARIAPNTKSAYLGMIMDLFPTFAEAAGAVVGDDIDGCSLLPVMLGQTSEEVRREMYFVRREGGAAYAGKTIEAIREGDWKLLQDSPFQKLELYNVQEDPYEEVDRAGDAKHVFRDLAAKLRKHIQRGGETPWQEPRH